MGSSLKKDEVLSSAPIETAVKIRISEVWTATAVLFPYFMRISVVFRHTLKLGAVSKKLKTAKEKLEKLTPKPLCPI